MGYPLTMGGTNTAEKRVSFNKLLPMNVDVLHTPKFQIGAIPNQTVWHNGDAFIHFCVGTDTLKVTPVALSYSIDKAPKGKITFDAQTGRFTYAPDMNDVRNFTVTFTVQAGNKTMSQEVKFAIEAEVAPEYTVLEKKQKLSPKDDYTIISAAKVTNRLFNNVQKPVRDISISGKELVFGGDDESLNLLNGSTDIQNLYIYAEKVIIKKEQKFYQTNVTIYAKELVFEDNNVIGSINTTPQAWGTSASGNGGAGANAGNITLYVRKITQPTSALRFICNGSNGQTCAENSNNGGSGGTVTSTVDVRAECQYFNGYAGISTSNKNTGICGKMGSFTLSEKQFAWLHPNVLSSVVKYAKEAYLRLNSDFTNTTFNEYVKQIEEYKNSVEWTSIGAVEKKEVETAETEMRAILYRIEQNLDYFGNPVAWVPMLSFEINKGVFEQEIESAINVMYLNYWLKKNKENQQSRIEASQQAIGVIETEISDNQKAIETLIKDIDNIQDQTLIIGNAIDTLTKKTESLRSELERKAEKNVTKRARINKTAGILSAIAKITPAVCSFFGPIGTGIGSAVGGLASMGSNILSKSANGGNNMNSVTNFIESTSSVFQSDKDFKNIAEVVKMLKDTTTKEQPTPTENKPKIPSFDEMYVITKPVLESMQNLSKVFLTNTISTEQIQAELNKLMSESKEFTNLLKNADSLNRRKEELIQRLATTFNTINTTITAIQKGVISLDGLKETVFNGSCQQNLRAMQYLDDMERNARERLLKYHYYMAKSYEYRTLEVYPTTLNITTLLEKTIETNKDKTLTAEEFKSFKGFYDAALSDVKEAIIQKFNTRNEYSGKVSVALSKEELETLNSGESITINIVERGFMPAHRENLRIAGFAVETIRTHSEGTHGSVDDFELKLEHSGKSMLRKDGEFYYFNHTNPASNIPSIQWIFDYRKGLIIENKVSAASTSLISSLLGVNPNETMIYSRPAVWADITISKRALSRDSKTMIIDSLVLLLDYDYVERNDIYRNLDIYARGAEDVNMLKSSDATVQSMILKPYIEISETDITERKKDGRAGIYRTYNQNKTITLTAPEEYGRFQFVNWTMRNDKNEDIVVSNSVTVSTKMGNDVYLTANYIDKSPKLQVVDTVYISNRGGNSFVQVGNENANEMVWNAESNDSWLQIISGSQGINNGVISFDYDENPTENERIGSISITTEDGQEKIVVVVQRLLQTDIAHTSFSQVRVYPNPVSNVLYIESEEITEIEITDMRGRFMYHTTITGNGSISTEQWKNGVYMVILKSKNSTFAYKIIKK
jgi:hypothetical protein